MRDSVDRVLRENGESAFNTVNLIYDSPRRWSLIGLKPGQQLRLLGSEFLFAEDSFITQFGKLLDGREDVRLTNRRSTGGLWHR